MVNTCVMWGCTNRSNKGDVKRHYYDLPKVITKEGPQTEKLTSERRVLWLERINRANFNPDPTKRHYKVCSDHFISGKKADLYDSLNPDWAPSLKLGPPSARPETPKSAVKRYQRTQRRREKRARYSAASALLDFQSEVEPEDNNSVSFTLRGQLEPQLIDWSQKNGSYNEDISLIMECENIKSEVSTTETCIFGQSPTTHGHTKDQSFKHVAYEKQFITLHQLQKRQTGGESFECETCGKTFSLQSHLNSHVKIHTGDEPFECETCGKTFSLQSHLNSRVKIRTGDQPFQDHSYVKLV